MHNWTKEDVRAIIGQLKASEMVNYKGVVFLRVDVKYAGSDPLMKEIAQAASACGGAGVLGLKHEVLETMSVSQKNELATQILEMAGSPKQLFPVVIVASTFLKMGFDLIVEFLIAHELSHIVHEDYVHGAGVCGYESFGSVPPAEYQADKFAVNLLGSNAGAMDAFNFYLEHLNDRLHLEGALSTREVMLKRQQAVM